MNVLPKEKQIQVVAALVEGNSIRSIERMISVNRNTTMKLLCRVGKNCSELMDREMRNLQCTDIQVDEIWCYVKKKRRRLTEDEFGNIEIGDQYIFVALDSDTKIVPSYFIGKRDAWNAREFMLDLQRRLANRIQITSDAFGPYPWAIETAFGRNVDYAQLRKLFHANGAGRGRYSPPDIFRIVSRVKFGAPNEKRISTSYVERQNLTMRMQMRRFTRLTNGFSKKLENLKAAVALHFAWYNFVRIHRTLKTTPAVAAGVAREPWGIDQLLN